MGVMPCGRHGCRNILCSQLILDGDCYICSDCYRELQAAKEIGRTSGLSAYDFVVKFMNSPRSSRGNFDDDFDAILGDE